MIPFNHFALLISASFGSKVIQCKKIGYVQFLHHIFALNKNIATIFREEPNGWECLLYINLEEWNQHMATVSTQSPFNFNHNHFNLLCEFYFRIFLTS